MDGSKTSMDRKFKISSQFFAISNFNENSSTKLLIVTTTYNLRSKLIALKP